MCEQVANCHGRRKAVIDRNPHVRDCEVTEEIVDTSSQNSLLDSSLTEVLCDRLMSEEFVIPGDNEASFVAREGTVSDHVQCQFHSARLFRRRYATQRTLMILSATHLYLYALLIHHPTFNPPSRPRKHTVSTSPIQAQPTAPDH